jgi:phosphoglycerate dehydrogenase-like enzyme
LEGGVVMKILLASPIDRSAVAVLEEAHDVAHLEPGADTGRFRAAADEAEVIVLRSGVWLSGDVMAGAPHLRLVVRAGSGVENIDQEYAGRHGVRVVRVPGMSAAPVAEFTFAVLLALARNVVVADRLIRTGSWPKPRLAGPLLRGKVLGVVGAGNIGSLVGEMGHAWGMRVLGCVKYPDDRVAAALAERGIELTEFDRILRECDFVTLHVPLDDDTFHLVDAPVLDRMRPGSLLVNMARGGVVEEKALYQALISGHTVAGAALDVHECEGDGAVSPFADLSNVVLTPHIGAMATDSQRLIGSRVVELIDAFEAGRLDEEVSNGERVV